MKIGTEAAKQKDCDVVVEKKDSAEEKSETSIEESATDSKDAEQKVCIRLDFVFILYYICKIVQEKSGSVDPDSEPTPMEVEELQEVCLKII